MISVGSWSEINLFVKGWSYFELETPFSTFWKDILLYGVEWHVVLHFCDEEEKVVGGNRGVQKGRERRNPKNKLFFSLGHLVPPRNFCRSLSGELEGREERREAEMTRFRERPEFWSFRCFQHFSVFLFTTLVIFIGF